MKTIILLLLFFSCTLFAQITITDTDVSNVFVVGNSATVHSAATTTFDIGTAGGGNNWDFSGLQSTETFEILSVDIVTTPYASEFPSANYATYSQGEYSGYPAEIWSYLSVNGTLSNLGQAMITSAFPGILITLKDNPAGIELQLPMTYNTSWSQNYTETIYYSGNPLDSTSYSTDVVVDAWGTMTMPGGSSFDALRIRESETSGGNTSVNYSFLAKNGANVTVSATDENPPANGVINADWYDWNSPFTSGVEKISGLPGDFSLTQNYPNPFNPSTKIEYTIPEESLVQLKVYDVLGNQVAELVNEGQSSGTYGVDFKAENLSSGLYIARLSSGNYTKTIKMTLLK